MKSVILIQLFKNKCADQIFRSLFKKVSPFSTSFDEYILEWMSFKTHGVRAYEF